MKNIKKQNKPRKSVKLKKSSVKSIDPETVAVGVGVGAALLGLAYIEVISPILKKKRIEAEEARENSAVNETVRNRIAEKAESVKAKALKLVVDIKTIVESYSVGNTPKTSPTLKIAVTMPVVLPKTSPTATSPKFSRNYSDYSEFGSSVSYQPRKFKHPTKIPTSPVRIFKKIPEEFKKEYEITKNYNIAKSMEMMENIIALVEQVKSPLKSKLSKEDDELAEDISEKLLEAIEYEYDSGTSSARTSGSGRSRTSAASLKMK